MGLKSCKQDVT